jgi:hypothetical protein
VEEGFCTLFRGGKRVGGDAGEMVSTQILRVYKQNMTNPVTLERVV